ncbi:MAG: hypothetical protein EP298_00560 [Gammaproteobacteria bacterium]|nr:MAG: hypothetical protein EP298_00560 [Gammaproteobacteria bacterium]UTW41889.1 hypothetical protein KFE69_10295 [bacterium SCSIO 12844]
MVQFINYDIKENINQHRLSIWKNDNGEIVNKHDDETEEKINCSLVTVSAILGLPVSNLKKNLQARYDIYPQTKASEYFVTIGSKDNYIPFPSCDDQAQGIKKYFHDLSKEYESSPKVVKVINEKLNKNELYDAKNKLGSMMNQFKDSTSLAVAISSLMSTHWIYGQKDENGKICFIDFQRDKEGDRPEVLGEPMFSILENNGNITKARTMSQADADVSLLIIAFDKIAPGWIQDKIKNEFKVNKYDEFDLKKQKLKLLEPKILFAKEKGLELIEEEELELTENKVLGFTTNQNFKFP